MRRAAAACALALVCIAQAASAHPYGQKPVAFISRDASGVRFEWVIAPDEVRALITHLGLGPIRPETLADAPAFVAYMRARVRVVTASGPCEMARVVVGNQVATGVSLRSRFECGAPVEGVTATVTLLHDLSPDYITLWQAATGAGRQRGTFTATRPAQRIAFTTTGPVLPEPSTGARPRGLSARIVDAVQTGRALPLALLFAFLLGAGHALAPGHGKTLAAAVMASGGAGTSIRPAVRLAGVVAATHLASVATLSVAATAAGSLVLPQTIAPALQVAAGMLAIALGVRTWMRARAPSAHGYDHAHDHVGGPRAAAPSSITAGIAGGLIPSPGAVAVTLVAFSAGRWVAGIAALIAFSAGLALVVFTVALLAARGSSLFERSARMAAALPRAAGAAMIVAGLALVAAAVVR